MIQRIQTVYLALCIIALSLLFAFPLAGFLSDHGAWIFSITGLKNKVPDGAAIFQPAVFYPLILVNVLIILLAAFTIFQYKNRQLQIRLTSIGVLGLVLYIIGIFFLYIPLIEKKVGIVPDYASNFGIYLPLVALVCMVLANRAIKRDDRLVRSADRLR